MSEYDSLLPSEPLPERQVDEVPESLHDEPLPEVSGGDLTEEQEQALRDSLGYSKAEKRSKAERDRAAAKMRAYADAHFPPLNPKQFPALPGDLAPSPEAMKKLGGLWPGR